MELIAAAFGLSIAAWVTIAVVAGLLFPAFWLWMLVDAILRDTAAYPSRDSAEKVVWIVAMLVLQLAAPVYFLLVWRPGRQGARQPTVATGPAVVA